MMNRETAPERRKDGLRHLLVLAFFVLASLVYTYPLVGCLDSCVRNTADPLLNAWILAWDVRQLFHDPGAMFAANMFYPHANTLAYSESQFSNALLAMPILLATQRPILAHNFVYLFSFVMSGFGTFLLVKHLTGRWTAGVAAGLIFAFTPYRFSHFQIQMLATQWMPLALLYLDKALRRQRWSDFFLFTLFFNLTMLASYYYGLFFSVVVVTLGMVYVWLLRREIWRGQVWVKVAVMAGITAVVNIPLALPYFSLAQAGFVRDIATTELFKLRFVDFLLATPENWLYGGWGGAWRGEYWSEHIAFPGIIAAGLAVVGLAGTRHRQARQAAERLLVQNRGVVWGYTAVFLVTVILGMGATLQLPGSEVVIPLPFSWLFHHVPGFQGLRAPSRFVIVSLLSLAVLSGFGWAWVQAWWQRRTAVGRRPSGKAALLFAALLALIALEYLAVPIPFQRVPAAIPPVYGWLAEQEANSPLIELPFPQQPGLYVSTEGLRLYYSTFHWQPLVNGYSGFVPPGYDRLRADMQRFPDATSISRLNELGVRYVVFHHDLLPADRETEFQAGLNAFGAALTPVAEFPTTTVYEVQPQGGAAARRLLAESSFGGELALMGFGLDRTTAVAGETVTVTLLWRGVGVMAEDYTAFVHLLDGNGRLLAQYDQPLEPPTTSWTRQQIERSQHPLTIPETAVATQAQVVVGVYAWPALTRLPLQNQTGQPLGDTLPLISIPIDTTQ